MAKILNGPLAAGISGSIGNLTFLDTRFGQVVQKKPIGPVHTTAAALATKNRFRQSMLMMRTFGDDFRGSLKAAASAVATTQQGMWVGPMINHISGGDWPFNPRIGGVPPLIIRTIGSFLGALLLTTSLDVAPALYSCWYFYTKDGEIEVFGGTILTTDIDINGLIIAKPSFAPPYDVHLVPFLTADPATIGPGGLIESTIP